MRNAARAVMGKEISSTDIRNVGLGNTQEDFLGLGEKCMGPPRSSDNVTIIPASRGRFKAARLRLGHNALSY